MAYNYDSAATIVSDAALELGLVSAAVSDPYASTDPNILQLNALLKSCGREISRSYSWTHLQSEYTFSTANGTASYVLPTDFRTMIPQSGWNRTTQWPLGGPLSPQAWQYTQAVSVVSTVNVLFRPKAGRFYLTPTPTSTVSMAFEYLTYWWASAAAGTVPTEEAPTAATDLVFFDPHLVTRALIHAFKKAKGFDTTSSMADYSAALEMAKGDNAAAPVLSIDGQREYPLLDLDNVPDTGYG
jgi:hypothetical protein